MKLTSLILFLTLTVFGLQAADERLVVHEWGTFTSLQNNEGRAIGWLNADDEALPKFVKTLNPMFIRTGDSGKGLNFAHPDVTMRLETPVVYFHPPKTMALPHALDVSVDFKRGWLTQFYPGAKASAPGMSGSMAGGRSVMGPIKDSTVGTLEWKDLKVGVSAEPLATMSRIWNAPRAVSAATVANAAGEAEKYLFYRGVGKLDAPLKVTRPGDGAELRVSGQCNAKLANVAGQIKTLWYAHFRSDGTCAFAELHPEHLALCTDETFAMPATFSPGQYGKENLGGLRKSMREGLISDGLFADEADALLNTWESSYFKSSGLRLFFLVPRAWTDDVLPLKVSEPADMVRTMVGRIELLSPEQQDALARIQKLPDTSEPSLKQMQKDCDALGRFRTPLLLEHLKLTKAPMIRTASDIFAVPEYKVTE